MSVSLTLAAVRARQKTVTRRHVDRWKHLKPGERLTLIEKGMGLMEGAKQVVVAEVEVIDVRVEPLRLLSADVRYGRQELALEGFEGHDPVEWVAWWAKSHGVPIDDETPGRLPLCRRIEWRYLDGAEGVETDG